MLSWSSRPPGDTSIQDNKYHLGVYITYMHTHTHTLFLTLSLLIFSLILFCLILALHMCLSVFHSAFLSHTSSLWRGAGSLYSSLCALLLSAVVLFWVVCVCVMMEAWDLLPPLCFFYFTDDDRRTISL